MKRGTTIPRAGLEIRFARELPRSGSGEVEALARVRIERRDEQRSERLLHPWTRNWRDRAPGSLGELLEPWPLEPFPQLLEAALADPSVETAPRVWMSAESQSWLAKYAPRTFKLLLHETELFQRDACFALVREGDSVRLAWRAEGAVLVEARPAPLFETAHALARGRVRPAAQGDDGDGASSTPDMVRLLRAFLIGTWVTGRLAHELEWIAATRSYRLRDGERALYLREGQGGARSAIWLSGDGLAEPLEVAVSPPAGTPAAVVRACLEWLLATTGATEAEPADGELYLDEHATHVRELG